MVMVIALVFTVAALVALAVLAVRANSRAQRHASALERLEQQLGPISRSIRDSVERSHAPADEPGRDRLGPRIEELLERIAADGSAVVAVRRLAEEVAPDVATRRPTARGNRQGYEAELEREIARARRTGRPLSLVLVEVDQPTPERVLQLAALLTRVARITDTVSRRRRDAFGILLPETGVDGAGRFFARLTAEAAQTFAADGHTTFTTGIVEWQASESGDTLDARARAEIASRPDRAADAPN